MAIDLDNLPPWALPVAAGGVLGVIVLVTRKGSSGNAAPALSPYPVTGQEGGGGSTTPNYDAFMGLFGDLGDTLGGLISSGNKANSEAIGAIGKQQSESMAGLGKVLGDSTAAQAKLVADLTAAQAKSSADIIAALLHKTPVSTVDNPSAPPPANTPPSDNTPAVQPGTGAIGMLGGILKNYYNATWAQLRDMLGGLGNKYGDGQTRLNAGNDTGYGFVLPVAYNGDHDNLGLPYANGSGESSAMRVARWVAQYMADHLSANPVDVAREAVARLGADALDSAQAPIDIAQDAAGQILWDYGFDFGPVFGRIREIRSARAGGQKGTYL